MNTVVQPWWLRFSERAFSFNFIAFSFVMFSCWFPTGFSATFSTFAFLFALPLCFFRVEWANISLFEKAGLVLFAWLFVSVFWSDAGVLISLSYLFEYRLYFMVPIFALVLLYQPKTQKWAFYAAVSGACIALITSYGLGLGWWKIEGAHFSLANRIYHGFIMSTLLLVILLAARNTDGVIRIIWIAVAAMIIYNVFNIETGRTGYLLVIGVSCILVALSFRYLFAAILYFVLFVGIGAAYLTLDKFSNRVDEAWANLDLMLAEGDYKSSGGYRLEFYQGAILIGASNPLGGVGVGDAVTELEILEKSGHMRVLTDNVHSEFMNMLIIGGVPALLLFLMYLLSIFAVGFKYRTTDKIIGDFLLGIGLIIFISAIFNSIIKDYGEKHALVIILSLVSVKLLEHRLGYRNKTGLGTPKGKQYLTGL